MRPWRALGGCAIIKVSGSRPEEFLNAAVTRGIHLQGVRRAGPALLLAAAAASDVAVLNVIAREQGARLSVLQQAGWITLWQRLESRWAWAAAALVTVGLFYLAAQFIWFIQVAGVSGPVERQIRANLLELGVHPGIRRSAVNPDQLQRQLLLRVERLTWVGVRLDGTFLRVSGRERIVPEALGYGPADLVARKDALILEVIPLRGAARVQVGQMVSRGEVIVAGVDQERPVRADAVVFGIVWYEAVVQVPLEERVYKDVGPVQRRYGIAWGRWQWLWPGRARKAGEGGEEKPATEWRERVIRHPFRWGSSETPFAWLEAERRLVQGEMIRRTPTEAMKLATERAWESVRKKLPPGVEVLENTEEIQWLDGGKWVQARVVIATREHIGAYRLRLDAREG